MNNKLRQCLLAAALIIVFATTARSQFSLGAQLRTRTELRDGQGAPLSKGDPPAFFTSQRTRLNASFQTYRLKFGASLQDVRVWGQDVSTINRTTVQDYNGLLLHEAWAQIQLTDTTVKERSLDLKLGRQELIYDDQRLLGNLDWLQQGRRHDAAVLKFDSKSWMIHLGAAYNQNREKSSGTVYDAVPPGNYGASTNGGTMYKSMEFLYASRKVPDGNLSFLFFADQFNSYDMEPVNNVMQKIYTGDTWSRATTGVYFDKRIGKWNVNASAYHQFGRNAQGVLTDGHLLTVNALYRFGKLSAGPGVDFTAAGFDPLYGTPHKFWGLMDYFYAGNLFGGHGLVDYFVKSRYKVNEKLSFTADLHHFTAARSVSGYSREYGQEIDIVGTYALTPTIGFELGYGHFFATPTLGSPAVKNISDARRGANWAYLMINIKPDFIK